MFLLCPVVALADEGALLFERGGALHQKVGDAQPVEVLKLPPDLGTLRGFEAAPGAQLVVLDFGGKQAWLVPGDGGVQLRTGPCTGRARPSPTAECVVCPSEKGLILTATGRDATMPLPLALTQASFRGPSGWDLVGVMDGQVLGVDRRHPREAKPLATQTGHHHLVVAPDGQHAVAVFGEGPASRIRSFLLDGAGVSRQLGGPGVPVVWSWDSQWLLMQEGILPEEEDGDDDEDGAEEGSLGGPESRWLMAAPRKKTKKKKRRVVVEEPAPKTRACVARAVGGEVKCWNDFEGLGFAPDSLRVLLRKGNVLYVGDIPGVRPTPPRKLLEGVDGPATWLPAALPQ